MSKKYVIDLPDDAQYILINGASENHCYTRVEQVDDLEELNSDYINENYGSMQDEAYQRGFDDAHRISGEEYQRGLNDMWDAVKKISLMTSAEAEKVFAGAGSYNRYNLGYSGVEAMDAYKAYLEKKDRIEVGDEVVWTTDNITLIVTSIYKVGSINWCDGVAKDGKVYSTLIENDRKTGKHYDIASILEAMRK